MTFALAPIGALADVALGKMLQPHRRNPTDELRPYLRAAHVQPRGVIDSTVEEKEMWFSAEERDWLDLRVGDVVVVEGGAGFGRAAHVDQPMQDWAFQNSIVRVRPLPGRSEGRFLTYALRAALDAGTIEIATSTATIPHFTAEKVGRFRVPAPERELQDRIADYLDRETSEIEAMDAELDQLVETLRERRQTVVETPWSRTRPPGWDVRPLWSMFRREKILGFTEEPMVSVFRQHGVVFKDDHDNLNVTAQNRSIYQLVEPGWLVVNRMKAWQGSVGVSSIRGITSGHYICFRPIHDEDDRYLNWMFRSPHYKDWFAAHSRGVRPGQAEIDNSYLDGMPIVVPPRDEQCRIVAELDEQTARIDDMIADAERLKGLLAERCSTLITDVVTGKKEVPA